METPETVKTLVLALIHAREWVQVVHDQLTPAMGLGAPTLPVLAQIDVALAPYTRFHDREVPSLRKIRHVTRPGSDRDNRQNNGRVQRATVAKAQGVRPATEHGSGNRNGQKHQGGSGGKAKGKEGEAPGIWRVYLTEHERGWGSRVFMHRDFKTEAEALKYMKEENAKNTATSAPDYYIQVDSLPKFMPKDAPCNICQDKH